MSRRNILIIYADQWRHDQFGADASHTPNLDALARESVSFTHHYTQAIPCSPSRACIYTGLMPQTHGVFANNVPLDARHKTLGQYLRCAGYTPTLFGYTDTRLDPRLFEQGDPRRHAKYQVLSGFELGCHQPDDNPSDWMAHLRAKGLEFHDRDSIYTPDFTRHNATGGAAGHPARYRAEDSDTAYLTDRLLAWQSVQEPGWCAMLNYLRPHRPTVAPEPWNAAVDPASLAAPTRATTAEAERATHPYMHALIAEGDAAEKCPPGLSGAVSDVAEQDWRSIRAIHLALMAELDAHVGRVIEQLKASGQWDNTLIVFSSDHGEAMFDHYLCNQASWHEQCAHVPFMIRLPGAEARAEDGNTTDAFTGGIDLIPTLLDWLGEPIPQHLDGCSLMPFLRGEAPADWRDHIRWEFFFGDMASGALGQSYGLEPRDCVMSVLRDRDMKHVYMPGLPPVLIDLANDPRELINLAGDPAWRDTERTYLDRQLRAQMHARDRSMVSLIESVREQQ